ncbi:MAG TPA: hypothetical protein VNA13_05210 [Xanthomonadales bacterium]|nr:hypothetical protein [Xanthomonadales bacterium]
MPRKRRAYAVLRYSRTMLGELAAATLIALMIESFTNDLLTLTKLLVLFILSSSFYIYLEELLYDK